MTFLIKDKFPENSPVFPLMSRQCSIGMKNYGNSWGLTPEEKTLNDRMYNFDKYCEQCFRRYFNEARALKLNTLPNLNPPFIGVTLGSENFSCKITDNMAISSLYEIFYYDKTNCNKLTYSYTDIAFRLIGEKSKKIESCKELDIIKGKIYVTLLNNLEKLRSENIEIYCNNQFENFSKDCFKQYFVTAKRQNLSSFAYGYYYQIAENVAVNSQYQIHYFDYDYNAWIKSDEDYSETAFYLISEQSKSITSIKELDRLKQKLQTTLRNRLKKLFKDS